MSSTVFSTFSDNHIVPCKKKHTVRLGLGAYILSYLKPGHEFLILQLIAIDSQFELDLNFGWATVTHDWALIRTFPLQRSPAYF